MFDYSLPTSSLETIARQIILSYNHKVTKRLHIDYKISNDGIRFHIFPKVPDYTVLPPNAETFAKRVEEKFVKILGPKSDVRATLHARDQADPITGKIKDTRYITYYRTESGELVDLIFHEPVDMLFIWVKEVIGPVVSKEQLTQLLLQAIEEAENASI